MFKEHLKERSCSPPHVANLRTTGSGTQICAQALQCLGLKASRLPVACRLARESYTSLADRDLATNPILDITKRCYIDYPYLRLIRTGAIQIVFATPAHYAFS